MKNIVNIVPFSRTGGITRFSLQRRDEHAETRPNLLGLWGGEKEGDEDDGAALLREVGEELEGFKLEDYFFLGVYADPYSIKKVYAQKVPLDFLKNVVIHEGKDGGFLNLAEIESSDEITNEEKEIFRDLLKKIYS